MITKTITMFLTTLTCLGIYAAGVYFVSGGDFRRTDIIYLVETTEPNQAVNIAPSYGDVSWSVKTEKQEFEGTNNVPIVYTYQNPGLHIVCLYHVDSYGLSAYYNFGYTSSNRGTHIVRAIINENIDTYWSYTGLELAILNCAGDQRNGMFNSCTNLKQVTFNNSITSIGNQSFYDCNSLTNIVIPSSVTNITSSAFGYCKQLKNVDFGNGLISIGNYAFANCISLTDLVLPETIGYLGNNVWYNTPKLTNVTFTGKTMQQVRDFSPTYFPWGLKTGTTIHCSDGTFTIE